VFTEAVQIGIVVRDLEAAMRTYVDDYGIGPWEIYEFNLGNAKDLREYGQPAERSWRLAVTMVGQVMWELIEPLDDESVYARFLAEKGRASTTSPSPLRASTRRWRRRRQRATVSLSAASSADVRVAYLATDRDLGVITEIFCGTPDGHWLPLLGSKILHTFERGRSPRRQLAARSSGGGPIVLRSPRDRQ
jgi:methylmalonyl-CoA/ethylmalonyl-CoA epimerase